MTFFDWNPSLIIINAQNKRDMATDSINYLVLDEEELSGLNQLIGF